MIKRSLLSNETFLKTNHFSQRSHLLKGPFLLKEVFLEVIDSLKEVISRTVHFSRSIDLLQRYSHLKRRLLPLDLSLEAFISPGSEENAAKRMYSPSRSMVLFHGKLSNIPHLCLSRSINKISKFLACPDELG